HLRAAAANLANPAHQRHAPGVTRAVFYADQLSRLQLDGHLGRPAQAVASGALVDDANLIAGKTLVRILLGLAVLFARLAVLDVAQVHALVPVDRLRVEGIRPDVLGPAVSKARRS